MREENMQRRRGIPRVAVALVAVGCAVACVSVAGAAELRADQLVRATSSTTRDKTALAIETGDTVTWDFAGAPGVTHNVQKDPQEPATADPNWEAFKSDYASSGRAGFTFTKPGTYKFVCGAHSTTMFGTVEVTGDPVEPTATPTETPDESVEPTITPRPTTTATPVPTARPGETITTPAPTGSAALDRTAPALTKVSLKAVRAGVTVRFTLSEPAAVTIRAKRGKSTIRTVRLSARAGTRSLTIRNAKFVRGKYRFEIEARDARGNKAPVQRKNVKVTR
jgi:plastocyanin